MTTDTIARPDVDLESLMTEQLPCIKEDCPHEAVWLVGGHPQCHRDIPHCDECYKQALNILSRADLIRCGDCDKLFHSYRDYLGPVRPI